MRVFRGWYYHTEGVHSLYLPSVNICHIIQVVSVVSFVVSMSNYMRCGIGFSLSTKASVTKLVVPAISTLSLNPLAYYFL